ncbi:MAG: dipeptidase [Flavobacteriaceae bacterium]|nr:dipeptidase [Flavobacteriaceae bacterium]
MESIALLDTPLEIPISLEEHAKRLHDSIITIDTHNDIDVKNFTIDHNYTQDLDTQVNLPKMEKGGLDVSWMIVYTGQGELTPTGYQAAYANAMAKFTAIHKLCEEYAPERIELALNSKDVRRIVSNGKKVAMIGVENAYPIGTDLKNIEKFYKLGARYMSLAHNGHSQFSDSNTGELDGIWLHNGLSDMGKKAVVEMNRLGIMIDISHPSKEAIKQMIALSKAPVIASHSSARALCNHSRNLDDELLDLVKQNGGVVQTVAFGAYLNEAKNDNFVKARQTLYWKVGDSLGISILTRDSISKLNDVSRKAYFAKFETVQKAAEPKLDKIKSEMDLVNVSDFVNHIDYLVNKIGIEHVGISSDFDGGGGISGWDNASESLNVTVELLKRGYSDKEIAWLWGENLLRVMDEVQEVSRKLK